MVSGIMNVYRLSWIKRSTICQSDDISVLRSTICQSEDVLNSSLCFALWMSRTTTNSTSVVCNSCSVFVIILLSFEMTDESMIDDRIKMTGLHLTVSKGLPLFCASKLRNPSQSLTNIYRLLNVTYFFIFNGWTGINICIGHSFCSEKIQWCADFDWNT